jgi:8-oxo-dGTP pyrophosphatase MutT (NUDIX family)
MPADFSHIKDRLAEHRPVMLHDDSHKHACVLVPLVMQDGTLCLLLTKRTDRVEHHKGQISFPGGVVDDTDTSPGHTALRELKEEVGIPATSVELFGALNDIRIPTGFIVTPLVGMIDSLEEMKINSDEVAEALLIPLEKFFDPALCRSEVRELKGALRQIYVYDVWREPVWGATAHIIKQFTELVDHRR